MCTFKERWFTGYQSTLQFMEKIKDLVSLLCHVTVHRSRIVTNHIKFKIWVCPLVAHCNDVPLPVIRKP